MEKKSFADAVRGYSCSWEEGSPGEPVINRNFSFKYHSITGTNAKLEVATEKRSPVKKSHKSGKR